MQIQERDKSTFSHRNREERRRRKSAHALLTSNNARADVNFVERVTDSGRALNIHEFVINVRRRTARRQEKGNLAKIDPHQN